MCRFRPFTQRKLRVRSHGLPRRCDCITSSTAWAPNISMSFFPNSSLHTRGMRNVMWSVKGAGVDNGSKYSIIACAGNTFDFSDLLPSEYDPTTTPMSFEQSDALEKMKRYLDDLPVCRDYGRFISLQEPHSLAFFGYVFSKTTLGLCPFYDLTFMALAKLWKGARRCRNGA